MTARESRLYSRLVRSYQWLLRARVNAQKCLRYLDSSDAALVRHISLGQPDATARDTREKIASLKEAVEASLSLSDSFLALIGPDKPHGLSYRNPWVAEPRQKGKRRAHPRRG